MANNLFSQVGAAVGDYVAGQSLYRRYANTVNSLVGSLAGAFAAIAATFASTGRVDKSAVIVGAAAAFLAALSTRLTKNGVSPSNAQDITNKVVEELTHFIADKNKEVASAAPAAGTEGKHRRPEATVSDLVGTDIESLFDKMRSNIAK